MSTDDMSSIVIAEIHGVAASPDGKTAGVRLLDTSGKQYSLQFETTFANAVAASVLIAQAQAIHRGQTEVVPVPTMGGKFEAKDGPEGLIVTLALGVGQNAPLTFRIPTESISGLLENLRRLQKDNNLPRIS